MEERGLVGLEARTADGSEVGRIAEVVTDEESGEVTHVIVEREEERFEVRLSKEKLWERYNTLSHISVLEGQKREVG